MAEMNVEDTDIKINLDNPEDTYIYYSICDYSEAIVDQIDKINKNIKELCNFCGTCKNKANLDTIREDPLTHELVPLELTQFTHVEPSETSRVIKRTRTQLIEDPSKIKRINSKQFSDFLGKQVDAKSTMKDINREIIFKLQSISEVTPERSMSASTPLPQVHIETITLPYINYINRSLVVLPIPDDSKTLQIIFNSDGKWCPNGGIGPGYPKSIICPFYRSTGVSNTGAVNFPNMWFPFFRIKTSKASQDSSIGRGWIYKAWGLQSVKQLRKRLFNKFQIPEVKEEESESKDFLYCFLEKFSHWWQIQLSLQLPVEPGTLWDTNPILKKLKHIALNYDYDHFGGDHKCFLKNANTPKKYILESNPYQIYNNPDDDADKINGRLRGFNNLVIEDNEDI